jgi:hypothetical protein
MAAPGAEIRARARPTAEEAAMFRWAQRAAVLAVVSSFAVLHPGSAHANWPHDPAINVPVAVATGDQWDPVTVTDAGGGVIVAWYDWRSGNADVYAQRYDASGHALWAAGGVLVCGATGDQVKVRMVADGSGGAVLTWQDGRGTAPKVYAQRIDAAGVPQWAADGLGMGLVLIGIAQTSPAIAAAAAPNVVIAWEQSGNIVAQRLSGAGASLWGTAPLAICAATGTQQAPIVVYDPTSGNTAAVIAWRDDRSGNSDLYAQRVSTAGAIQWTADGIALCTAAGDQLNLSAYWERTLGVCLTWMDFRSGGYDVYAQRLDNTGAPQWAANGVAVCTATADQWYPRIVTGGTGKMIIGWEDWRTGAADIYAQDLNSSGAAQWTANGALLCARAGNQSAAVFAADGSGGVIGAWEDQRSVLAFDLYAQRLNSAGMAQWATDGVAVSTAFGDQRTPAITMVGSAASVIAWIDTRSGSRDIYLQGVDAHGLLGVAPVIASVSDVPNDQGGRVTLRWYASALDSFPDYAVTSYLVYSRAYGSATWVRADSIVAARLPGYSRLFATSVDSGATGNPRTSYRVDAYAAATGWTWSSDADSGYSVDNLAPPAPAQFAGTYSGGVTSLSWAASTAPDFAAFRVYRGVTPEAPELLTTLTGTSCSDPAGAPFYYRLAAVDVHGNESPAVTLLPEGTAGLVPGVPAARLALAAPAPNPLRTTTTLRLVLPRAGRASLGVYDAQGREVRMLLGGMQPAGERTIAWDGRDGAGRRVPGGTYFVRLESANGTRVVRLAVVR